jgi:hypothetical protein
LTARGACERILWGSLLRYRLTRGPTVSHNRSHTSFTFSATQTAFTAANMCYPPNYDSVMSARSTTTSASPLSTAQLSLSASSHDDDNYAISLQKVQSAIAQNNAMKTRLSKAGIENPDVLGRAKSVQLHLFKVSRGGHCKRAKSIRG